MTFSEGDQSEKRPVLWVPGGMATMWNGMGKDLLRIPTFKKTINRLQTILTPKNMDLVHIITSDDEDLFKNTLNSFVGIGAVQIGMINLLREIGLQPDFLVAPSFGEVAAGYIDGCLTEEQTILSAYYRGLSCLECSKFKGGNAFIGLGHEELKKILPEEFDDAAHMDANATCIAGPIESVEKFIAEMKQANRFAALIRSSSMAFHSRYIADAGPKLLQHLKEIIPKPKPRSSRWLSTSVHCDEWDLPKAKLCSAEYYVNNLLGCVFFEETSKLLPQNSIILEIGPTCLLKTTLKNNFPEAVYVALGDKHRPNGIEVFKEALEVMSKNGVNVDWKKVNDLFEMNNNN